MFSLCSCSGMCIRELPCDRKFNHLAASYSNSDSVAVLSDDGGRRCDYRNDLSVAGGSPG
jgi:hypothetical protein